MPVRTHRTMPVHTHRTMPVRTHRTTPVRSHRTTPVRSHRTTPVCTHRSTPVLLPCAAMSDAYAHALLHPVRPKSKADYVRTCSAFLLNDFSRKRLSEGVTNCAIIIALNIPLRTFSLHSTLTMSLRLAIKATQEEAGERTYAAEAGNLIFEHAH